MTRREDFIGSVSGDVAYDPTITPSAKAVYLVLAMHRNNKDDSTSWPSNATIASYTGQSVRTTIRAINELGDHGLLVREPQFRDGRQVNSITRLTDIVAQRAPHAKSRRGG